MIGVIPGWTFGEIIIALIIIAACLGILFVVTRAMGVAIPGWVIQIGWILVAAVLGILAIRFLLSL